jgi:hypothetical protein
VHDLLRAERWLSPDEAGVLRWAANSATVAAPRHATRLQYKKATAVEVLVRTRGASWLKALKAALGLSGFELRRSLQSASLSPEFPSDPFPLTLPPKGRPSVPVRPAPPRGARV